MDAVTFTVCSLLLVLCVFLVGPSMREGERGYKDPPPPEWGRNKKRRWR